VALAQSPAVAQERPDTLLYDIAIVTLPSAHLSVEARLTTAAPGIVTLLVPPSALVAGTDVEGFSATDDRGRPLEVRRVGAGYETDARPGAVRFRYRLGFQSGVAMSSTEAGLNEAGLYAVSRSVFVTPDPAAYHDTGRPYPLTWVHVAAPPGWRVVTGWDVGDDAFVPTGRDALLGATIAAAPDFRVYRDTAGGTPFVLAIRGERLFSDSALQQVIAGSLRAAAAVLGPVPAPHVTYTSDVGLKGRTSGSLQGLASIGFIWEPGELLELPRIHDLFHETIHLWLGGAMDAARWWTEGVTDYLAARLESEWHGRPDDLADLCYQSLRNYAQIDRNTSMTMDEEQRANVLGDNTSLLVYRKGMLAGLLLDAAIRRATAGQAKLDDAARLALILARSSPEHRVPDAAIRAVAVQVGGDDVDRVWRRVVEGITLISEAEVTAALHAVTGLPVTGPPRIAKEQKVLPGHPKP
jgi:predicted metalloprotease with PDZ domain